MDSSTPSSVATSAPKKRGRPPKAKTNDESLEKRRARVRRAQQAFLKRKEENASALKERVALLENVVRQLNENAIQSAHEIMRDQPSTSLACQRMVDESSSLAQQAFDETQMGSSSDHQKTSPSSSDSAATPDDRATSGTSSAEHAAAQSTAVPPSSVPRSTVQVAHSALLDPKVAPDRMLPDSLRSLGADPYAMMMNPDISQLALSKTYGGPSFADHLMWSCLLHGFVQTFQHVGGPTDVSRRLFRFITPYLPWESIKWHASWSIRSSLQESEGLPNSQMFPLLQGLDTSSGGEVVVRPMLTNMSEAGVDIAHLLNTLAESSEDGLDSFLVPSQVQEYLVSKGAFYFGYDVIHMHMNMPLSGKDASAPDTNDEHSLRVTLSVPVLMSKLVDVSACLGYSVGFPKADLDQIIADSAVEVERGNFTPRVVDAT